MTLSNLFTRCVKREYITTLNHTDYAYDRINDHLIIYFQDSDGASDWIKNLDFPAAAYRRDGKTVWYAHRGFLKAWISLLPRVAPLITDPTVKKITVVGYSHGAALAVFCHESVWFHRPDLRYALEGYAFGCPRVLWGRMDADIAVRWQTFTVIRNLPDIVTHVPPRMLGYHHVGHLLEIGKAGKYSAIDAHRPQNIRQELMAYEARIAVTPSQKMQADREKIAKKP